MPPQRSFAVTFLRALISVTFHLAVAFLLAWLTLDLFYPETHKQVQHAIINFVHPIKAKLQELPAIQAASGTSFIPTQALSAGHDLILWLYLNGLALLSIVQELSWSNIIMEVETRIESLMEWFLVLKELINKASGSTLGQLALLAAGLFVLNTLLAVVGIIRRVWGIIFYVAGVSWMMVVFIVHLPGNMLAFIISLC